MNDTTKRYHFMCAGEVLFSTKDAEGLHSMRLNAMISHDSDNIPVFLIGRMQQGLQFQFHQRMQDPHLIVRDVVVLNIVRLGQMTTEELHHVPAEFQPSPEHGGKLNG